MDLYQKQNEGLLRKTLAAELTLDVQGFIDQWVDWGNPGEVAILDTSSHVNLVNLRNRQEEGLGGMDYIINLKRLNDIRYVNKFLEAANESLGPGGYLIGCVETSDQRHDRLMRKFFWPFNVVYLFLDYLFKRVWPKMPYLKQLYFLLTAGHNRVISEMETYGRLYSCGFELLESIYAGGKLYFVAEKVKAPDFNMEASYGPLIRLRRVGYQGKIIKVYKFRTMYPYSEYLQEFTYQRNGLQTGGKFKDDPRVTNLGRFLRKYWLDELPMIINWFRGEIKFFGVRPISQQYFNLYPAEFREFRKKFKPGLLPPVYMGRPTSVEDVAELEKQYLLDYQRNPRTADLVYTFKVLYSIFIKRVRSH